MSGLILPPGMPGNGATHLAGLNPPPTTTSQLFSALFHGQARLQENLSEHKNHLMTAAKPKDNDTEKGDNVTQFLALLSPAAAVLPQLPSVSRMPVTTQHSLPAKASATTSGTPGTLPVSEPRESLADLLSGHNNTLAQQSDALTHTTLPQPRKAETQATALAHSPHHPLAAIAGRQSPDTTQPYPAERNPSIPQSVGVSATIVVPQSSHQRPVSSELKTVHSPTTPLLTSGSDALPRDTVRLLPATAVTTADSPEWQQQLSQQVLIMHHKGIQVAELRLHPQELGNLKISLVIKSVQAEMTFLSGHSQVRTAIEAALPHLKTALAENGISLGESHVGSDDSSSAMFNSSGGFGEKQPETASSGAGFTGSTRAPATLLTVERTSSTASPAGRVDLFV